MCKAEISVIPCSAEIDLNGITPVGNLMEINRTSETQKLRGNLTEILMEMLPEISAKIPLLTELPEITRKLQKETEISE